MIGRLTFLAGVLASAGCFFEGDVSPLTEGGVDHRSFRDKAGEGDAAYADWQAPGDAAPGESPGPNQVCSNGVREGTEACDGEDLGDKTCVSEGYDLGELGCRDNCTIDTSGCISCGSGEAACGGSCCASPDVCVSDVCCAASQVCGGQCCAVTESCVDNACCPADRVCGGACCSGNQICHDGTTCRVPTAGEIAIYVSSDKHAGALGGRNGADAICAADRPAALNCLNPRAFISFSLTDDIRTMASRYAFSQSSPLYFYNRALRRLNRFANNWIGAMDSPIAVNVAQGTGAVFSGAMDGFWTGSLADGTFHFIEGAFYTTSCEGFTTDQDGGVPYVGAIGDAQQTTAWLWWSYGYKWCSNTFYFLCACSLQ